MGGLSLTSLPGKEGQQVFLEKKIVGQMQSNVKQHRGF
jgi:hypothetical protein